MYLESDKNMIQKKDSYEILNYQKMYQTIYPTDMELENIKMITINQWLIIKFHSKEKNGSLHLT